MSVSAARAYQILFRPAFAAGLAAMALSAGARSTTAAQPWPHDPFGTPPSFSRDYPRPLYRTERFTPLQQLVDREKALEARRRSVPEARAETFTELQKIAPRGEGGPSQSALAYGPAEGSPRLAEPHKHQSGRPHRAKVKHEKPAPVHLAEHPNRRRTPSSKPTDILPPAAGGH
jgi:hypothetical protein